VPTVYVVYVDSKYPVQGVKRMLYYVLNSAGAKTDLGWIVHPDALPRVQRLIDRGVQASGSPPARVYRVDLSDEEYLRLLETAEAESEPVKKWIEAEKEKYRKKRVAVPA
jgi:hypothetical protein